ncbi:homeobox protein vent1-like [Pecten maximus]|uniref:homeobox protein vent1-like n=1 Tax=Pecten maximus TaxID=6579 RepID=UPI0014582867|nr:homeobox protein vent1-like [Pecten maximus]
MATTDNKKMSFSIENLAKSSRTEETPAGGHYGTYFINRNPWQDGDGTNLGDITTGVFSSPYYTNIGQTSPRISQGQFNSPLTNLRDAFRLISDDGYSSQNSTPSLPGSCKKRSRIVAEVGEQNNSSLSPVTGNSLKRKRIDVDARKPRNRSISQVQIHNDSFTDNDSSCGTSDSDEGIGETPRPKKARTAFSDDQIQTLEVRYKSQKYLPAGERSKLAVELGLTDQQVKTWFQNRRMKEKRNHKDDSFQGGMPLPTGGVDISQLQALGIPCPPPYTINNRHHQMMRDDSIPNFPSSTSSPQPPIFRTSQHMSFYSRFHPMTNSLENSPGSMRPTNQTEGYS